MDDVPAISVNPTSTTDYKVEIIESSGTASTTKTDFITIVVMEEIIISPEDSGAPIYPNPGSTGPQTFPNYMEQQELNSLITIVGSNLGITVGNLPKVQVHYQYPDGSVVNGPKIPMTTNEYDYMMIPEDVINYNNGLNYALQITASVEYLGITCTSSPMNVWIYTMGIEYFRDKLTNKDWKIRVGKKIEYSAFGSPSVPPENYSWGFPDHWVKDPSTGESKLGNDLIIPQPTNPNNQTDAFYTNLPSGSGANSYFGTTNGAIAITCINSDGDPHTVFSDLFSVPQKTKVFYNGMYNFHNDPQTGSSSANVPNWFYYYKDNETGGSGAQYSYGCEPTANTSYTEGIGIGTGNDVYIHICENAVDGRGFYIETMVQSGQRKVTGSNSVQGYKAFIGVLEHEREHCGNQMSMGSGPPHANVNGDWDYDGLSTLFEDSHYYKAGYTIQGFNSPDRWSANGGPPSNYNPSIPFKNIGFYDGEVEAGGPIEEAEYNAADGSQDWAILKNPTTAAEHGTNW